MLQISSLYEHPMKNTFIDVAIEVIDIYHASGITFSARSRLLESETFI